MSKRCHLIHKRLVRIAAFLGKARKPVAVLGLVELGVGIDRARQEALAERTGQNEAEAQLFQRRQYPMFWFAPEERILNLQSGKGLHRVGTANGVCVRFGHTEVYFCTFLKEFLDRSCNVLDRHIYIDPVRVKEVDRIHSEPLERFLRDLLDVLWPAVQHVSICRHHGDLQPIRTLWQ